jgi:hypothetical protein
MEARAMSTVATTPDRTREIELRLILAVVTQYLDASPAGRASAMAALMELLKELDASRMDRPGLGVVRGSLAAKPVEIARGGVATVVRRVAVALGCSAVLWAGIWFAARWLYSAL